MTAKTSKLTLAIHLWLLCTYALAQQSQPNFSYAGGYKGLDNTLSQSDIISDISAAYKFKSEKYPSGFITIYGGSRLKEKSDEWDLNRELNDKLYSGMMKFAQDWTKAYRSKYPIMTGAGPGIMEAASRGAKSANGPSIGYTTYYGEARRTNDAKLAFQKYKNPQGVSEEIITDGLIFSSVAIRESMMIFHSAAIVVAPGGTGTEWEIFQIIEMLKSGQLKRVPVFLVGNKKAYWTSFYDRLEDMIARGTIKRHEVYPLLVHVDDSGDLFGVVEKYMELK
jgi:predicted Rossmann-fold nucleotide-binding protein